MNFKKGRNQDLLMWQKFPRVCLHIQVLALPCTNQSSAQNLGQTTYNEDNVHTSYLSQTPQTCLCKNFLSGVNFSRLSEKKCIYLTFSETFLVFLVPLVVFLGLKFGFRKSCQCKRNDKYEVWEFRRWRLGPMLPRILHRLQACTNERVCPDNYPS